MVLIAYKAMYTCTKCTLVYHDTITFDDEQLKVVSNIKPCPDCGATDELGIKWG